MENINIGVVVIVAVVALALILFLIFKNQRDKKKVLPPDTIDDAVEETKMDQERRQDKV
jgi:hypothetical protein